MEKIRIRIRNTARPGTYIRRAVAQSSELELQAADLVLLLPISLSLGAQLGAHS
jgi:hypothetical protein